MTTELELEYSPPVEALAVWALDAALALERASGVRLIAPLSRTRGAERSRAVAVLAVWRKHTRRANPFHGIAPATVAADLLGAGQVRLLEQAYGPLPGFDVLLQKVNPDDVKAPELYDRIAHMLRSRRRRARRKIAVLQTMALITSESFDILGAFPDRLLDPEIVTMFNDRGEVELFFDSLAFLRRFCPQSERVLARMLLKNGRDVHAGLLREILLEHGRNISPLLDDPHFEVLRDGPRFQAVHEELGLCLDQRILDAALGITAYLRWQHGPVVVQLRRVAGADSASLPLGEWITDGLFGPHNAAPPPDHARQITAQLAARGISTVAQTHHPDIPRRFVKHFGCMNSEMGFVSPEDPGVLEAPSDGIEGFFEDMMGYA